MKTINSVLLILFFSTIAMINSLSIRIKSSKQSPNTGPPQLNDENLKNILFRMFSSYFFRSVDAKKKGSMTETEWINGSKSITKHYHLPTPSDDYLKNEFKQIDTDNSKDISEQEIKQFFKTQFYGATVNMHYLKLASELTWEILDPQKLGKIHTHKLLQRLNTFAKNRNMSEVTDKDFQDVMDTLYGGKFTGQNIYSNDFINVALGLFQK